MSKVKAYITSFRLRTLPLSISGVILGSMLAKSDGFFNTAAFVWAIITTISLQILSNITNEIGDLDKGTDNENRLGPIRSAQSGSLSKKEMIKSMITFCVIALIAGTLLIYEAFGNILARKSLTLFLIGGLSIVAAIKYTFGKNAYGYRGLGDIFVFIFFGLVSVLGSYFAMSGHLNWLCILPASAIGMLSTGVLNLNNMRDIDNDRIFKKKTIPVIIGVKKAKTYHFILVILSLVFITLFTYFHHSDWKGYLYLLAIPLFVLHLKNVYKYSGKELDSQLKLLSISTFLLSILTGIGQIIG